MCGIYGILNLDGRPVTAPSLSAMGRVTAHRGPDDEGLHIDGNCGIGMRRLSIIDLAGGHQPLSNKDETLWLVCNGEIYNFRELRRDLQEKGHHFKTGSDCEVIIHLYVEYGDTFVNHLNGMFGFALWDSTRRRLILGRDRLGIKPIYLRTTPNQIAFSTEAKALLTLPGADTGIDSSALRSFLHLGYVPAPQSMFGGITKLLPATLLIVEDGNAEERRYWQLPTEVDPSRSKADWVEAVRARLKQSVAMQMVSDVPIGAFLSGGIDSSAVVGYMTQASDHPIKTYSIGFGGSSADNFYNELPYAKRVAELFKTDHHEILVRPDVVALLPKLLWHMDEPVSDTAFVTTYLVSQFARKDVTVILSGVGGDELFGGYRRYLGNHYLGYFDRLPRWVRQGAVALSTRLPSDRHSGMLNVLRLTRGFLGSAGATFEERYRSYVQVFSQEASRLLVRTNHSPQRDALHEAFDEATCSDSLNRMLFVDARTQLPDDLLMLTDKMTMATSLECRVPLLDHELVELAARMPEDIKVHRGELKHVMKGALADLLPSDILHRKKRGFGTPMGAWLKEDLKPLLHRLLSREVVMQRGLFDHETILTLMTDHETNRVDGTDQLLALMNLEIWSRIYLDRRSPEDVTQELKDGLQ